MVKINCKERNVVHSFDKYYAFVDSKGDFYLIDDVADSVVRIDPAGCSVYDTVQYGSIEDFLENELDTTVAKVYKTGQEYEIIING
jgi:hypothetical protein